MAFIPQPLVEKALSKATEYVPIAGPAFKYGRKAMEVTKIANPVKASTRAVGYLVAACTGEVLKYPVYCSLWASFGLLGVATGNPVLIGAANRFNLFAK